jgi:N-acetylmuramoyl-L-alanine amidase
LSELRGKISEFEEKNEGGGNVDEDELEIFTSNFFDIYQNLLQANCEEGIRYLVERVNSKENKEDILKISKEKDGKTTRMEVGYKNLDAPSVTNFCEGSIKNIACGSVYKRGSNTLTLQECHKMWGVRGEKDCYFARPAFKNNNCVNCAEITSCKNLNYDKEQCENTGCLELARYEEGISCKWDEKEKKCVATKCERLCEQNIFEKLWSVVAPSTKCNEDNCEKISGCDWEVDKCYDSASGSEEEENGGSEGDSGGSEKETGSKESGIKTNDEKGEGSRGDGGKSKSNSGSGGEKTNTATAEEELLETTGWEEVPLVCVDAGHNKDYNLFDTKSSSEAETNLAIAKKVESELKNKKYDVAMSRTGERRVTFPDDSDECDASFRAYFANSEGCNIGVSIHSDANNGGKGSAIVCDMARKKRRRSSECPENCKSLPREYCQKGDYEISNPAEKSKKLAEEVLNELSTIWEMYGMGNGGIRMDTSVERVKTGELSSIGGVCSAEMPYVLVEVADHTDSEQQTYLQQSSFQEKLAESIASGIDKYARENLRERA